MKLIYKIASTYVAVSLFVCVMTVPIDILTGSVYFNYMKLVALWSVLPIVVVTCIVGIVLVINAIWKESNS